MSIKHFLALEETELVAQEQEAAGLAELQLSEQEANEELVSVEQDDEYKQLTQAEDVSEAVQHDVTTTVEASTALEAMADAISRSIHDGGLNVHGVKFANLAVEAMSASYGLKSTTLAICVENYKQDPLGALKAAMEDIQHQSQSLWSSIKDKLTIMANSLVTKLTSFKKNIARLENRTTEIESIIGKLDNTSTMRFGALKPQDWFIDLIYHGKAAPKGLVGVGAAVEKLLKETASTITSSIGKYSDWIKSNHEKAMNDASVFSSLKYRTNDFLVLNQKPFSDTRRLITAKASEGCAYYRSDELPGGMALYTHLAKADQNGASAISCLGEVDYRLEAFDPVSYDLTKGLIATAVGLAVGTFVGLAIGLGIGAPIIVAGVASGSQAMVTAGSVVMGGIYRGSQIAYGVKGFKSGYEGAANGKLHGSQLKLTKDMLFETLSLVEAKRVLSEVRKGIAAMRAWENVVFKEIWKDQQAANVIEKLLDRSPKDANTASVRLLKNLCFCIFNLQAGMSGKTLSYSIRTYNSMLNYVQKSSYQYR